MSLTIKIASDFSRTPGARFRIQSKFSGEQFREECLEPKFLAASDSGVKIIVDLDGTAGYLTSFLEEAFGGLARIHGIERVKDCIAQVITDEEPYLEKDIFEYISHANEKKYRK